MCNYNSLLIAESTTQYTYNITMPARKTLNCDSFSPTCPCPASLEILTLNFNSTGQGLLLALGFYLILGQFLEPVIYLYWLLKFHACRWSIKHF